MPDQPPETSGEQGNKKPPHRWAPGQSGNPNGRPRKVRPAPLPGDLTLLERMLQILPQEWSDDDLREMARNPAGFRRLMEVAVKANQGPGRAGGPGEAGPAPADETTADLLVLIDDLLSRHGVQT